MQPVLIMIKKLLCVDDDKITLTLIKLIVGKASFADEIITKMNGQEALDYYTDLAESSTTEPYPELIFLDLNMPIMSGWDFLDEFAKTFYKKFSNTKVIILSSSTDPEEKAKIRKYPMIIEYLTKPLTIQVLKNIII
jgi:CheY-like chemotaxis protein